MALRSFLFWVAALLAIFSAAGVGVAGVTVDLQAAGKVNEAQKQEKPKAKNRSGSVGVKSPVVGSKAPVGRGKAPGSVKDAELLDASESISPEALQLEKKLAAERERALAAERERKLAAELEKALLLRPEEIGKRLAAGEIGMQQIPNPHWREGMCSACHNGEPKDGAPSLRTDDLIRMCNNCHNVASVNSYIHAVGMAPSKEKYRRMSEPFRQAISRGGGLVTCIVCHDLPMQCKKERVEERTDNPRFFRGGPYEERTDLCFNCHDPDHYGRLNPHDQITDEGELNTQRCLVCHNVTPKLGEAKSINDVSFNVADDLKVLCTGCHPWRPHPGGNWASFSKNSDGRGPNHLILPPVQILNRLKESEQINDVVLPLEPKTGKVFCATCHNPHERGVQHYERADKGADAYKRLRTSGAVPICVNCHDK